MFGRRDENNLKWHANNFRETSTQQKQKNREKKEIF